MDVIDRNEILARSSVVYGEERLKNPDSRPNFLLGNGRFGGNVNCFGCSNEPDAATPSFFWHKHHVEVPEGHDLEARLPLLKFSYALRDGEALLSPSAENVSGYSQTLDLITGTAVTAFTLNTESGPLRLTVRQFVSLADTFLSEYAFTADRDAEVVFTAEMMTRAISHKKCPVTYPCALNEGEGFLFLRSSSSRGYADAALYCESGTVRGTENTLTAALKLKAGVPAPLSLLLVSSRGDLPVSGAYRAAASLTHAEKTARHEAYLSDFWSRSAISTGNETLDGIWYRFLFALRCSESTAPSVPLSPGGLASGGLWPFEFPQDYLWMYESYFASNHPELASGTARYWITIAEQCRAFTREKIGTDGIFFPWVPSNFDLKEMERPAMDPPYSWQLHNAAYPVRMIRLYYEYFGDEAYLAEMMPVIEGVADFYAGISTCLPERGKWGIAFTPCMGQDEFGGFCRSHYLCCMLSAAYVIDFVLKACRVLGKEPKEKWVKIGEAGYDFERLTPTGMFATYDGGPTPNPAQKHPSQLNILASLPYAPLYSTPAFAETHRRRCEFSINARENFWTGWSLGTFLISSVRFRDSGRIREDLNMLLTNPQAQKRQTDPDFVQFYETGGQGNRAAYFHTVMGMTVTALTELFLQCFDGKATVFPVDFTEKPTAFEDLLTPFGFTVSGQREGKKAELLLKPKKPGTVFLRFGEGLDPVWKVIDENGTAVASGTGREISFSASEGVYSVRIG